ncbi:MAG: XRE family transcriptional regulator [Desulfobacteraceae bacterium]|nr:MAG: XRE family transcriptional regulator [Desulfobacteraceae bacterium]
MGESQVKSTLRDKYKQYPMVVYKVIAPGEKKGRVMACSLCGKEYRGCIEKSSPEIICPLCTMRLADAYQGNKENYINLEELLDAVREGLLLKYRSKNGLSRADLGRYIHVAPKYIQRIENLQTYPTDRLVKAIKKKIDTVHSSGLDH